MRPNHTHPRLRATGLCAHVVRVAPRAGIESEA
jgi:hypothetical protein